MVSILSIALLSLVAFFGSNAADGGRSDCMPLSVTADEDVALGVRGGLRDRESLRSEPYVEPQNKNHVHNLQGEDVLGEPSNVEDERINPERWLVDYASTGNRFEGGVKFILDVSNVSPDETNVFDMTSQAVFQWHQSFGNLIRSNAQKIKFSLIISGDVEETYTAWKSKELNARHSVYGEDTGILGWEGVIAQQQNTDNIDGDLSCTFSWGNLRCLIRIFLEDFDSYYEIVMDESAIYVMKTVNASDS